VNPHIRAGARIDGSYEQPRKHGAVSSARCSDPRKIMSRPSCRVKAPLGRREHTIAPDPVTGHLDGVHEEFPCRLNLCDANSIAQSFNGGSRSGNRSSTWMRDCLSLRLSPCAKGAGS
jgi:hypothetical protein